jgi:hypothetical protein
MAYRKVNKSEKDYYMELRATGKTQILSSNRSGLSERTGRRLESAKDLSSATKKDRQRTRSDPFLLVWKRDILPLLELSPDLQPIIILEELQERYPGLYPTSLLRTLQRRIKEWKSLHGQAKAVIFRQKHLPGTLGISDFTELKDILITIQGKALEHRLYHYRMVYSGWSYVKVILGGESFTALAEGLQGALQAIGGSPKEHRTDSLSAAFNNNSEKEELTKNYEAFCKHYNIIPTRNNKGVSHENGAIESPHGHLKRRMRQALLLRQSSDFESLEAYEDFIGRIVLKRNSNCTTKTIEEKTHLNTLPEHKAQDYTIDHVFVTSSSTITIKKVLYTVPSRLVGERVNVHVYDNRLYIYYGSKKTCTLTRVRSNDGKAVHNINYRHIIASLVQKPQAFRMFVWREELLPTDDYIEIWQIANNTLAPKTACKYIVNLLSLAAKQEANIESSLARYVLESFNSQQKLPSIEKCMDRFNVLPGNEIPVIESAQRSSDSYNFLLSIPNVEEVSNAA